MVRTHGEKKCGQITGRYECLTTNNPPDAQFKGSCVWCPDGPCHERNKNRCEPKSWLISASLWDDNSEECLLKGSGNECFFSIKIIIYG